jgi:hypothetical protein
MADGVNLARVLGDELVLHRARTVADYVVSVASPELSTTLQLVNGGDVLLGYKAKTNAPGRWLVRPNVGVIEPGASLAVAVTLLSPLSSTAGAEFADRRAGMLEASSLSSDRFLLISAAVSPEEAAVLRERRADGARADCPSLREDHPSASLSRIAVRLMLRPPPTSPSPRMRSLSLSSPPPSPPPASPQLSPALLDAAFRAGNEGVPSEPARVERTPPSHGGAGGEAASEALKDGYTPFDEPPADGASEGPSEGPGTLAGRLLALLAWPLDELAPWFKYKLFDILWASALLLIAKRVRCVARLQKVLDL